MLGKRLINSNSAASGATCTTDTLQILGDTSCIAYYKMSDATDESGNYDGTPTSVNFNVAGKFGNAGEFNGSSSKIEASSLSISGNTSFSFSLWVKTNDVSTEQWIIQYGASTGDATLYLQLDSNGFSVNNYTTGQYFPLSITANNWYHCVIGYDSSASEIFIQVNNGTRVTKSATVNISSSNLLIGHRSGASSYLNGSIDQVRIFNKALTSTEVTTLYNEVYCVPTIVPTDYFEPVIYTGDGTSSNAITGVGFKPDLVWLKDRSAAAGHWLNDSVRGAGKGIMTQATSAEITSFPELMSSFDSDGFTVGYISNNTTNFLNNPYVSWNWKAGGADVLNQEGTIDSQVSANVDSGFSIVSWTGNGNDATVGTGLSQQAELVITKGRANLATYNSWITYHKDLSTNYHLYLNTTDSEQNGIGDYFRDSAFTSEVFGLGNDIYGPNVNNTTMIAYCFHSVDGMSKIGSFNQISGNTSVVTGFRPAFLMMKRTDNTGNWMMFDNKRGDADLELDANLSAAEVATTGYTMEFQSNGFVLTIAAGTYDVDYIFMAFAEEVFNPNGVTRNATNPFGDASEVALYKFEDNANDAEGNYNGTASNVTYATGYIDKAAVFNGSSSRIATGLTLPADSTMSFSFWLKSASNSSGNNYFLSDFDSSASNNSSRLSLAVTANNGFRIWISNGSSNWDSTDAISLLSYVNVWTNLVVTIDGTDVKVYINGGTPTTLTSSVAFGTAGSRQQTIGRAGDLNGAYYEGSIDQVRIFDRALDSGEVTQLANE